MTRQGISRLLIALVALWTHDVAADSKALKSALTKQLSVNAQRYGVAGQAVLILRNGEVVYRGSQGFADLDSRTPVRPEDIFPVFSLSKMFADVLIMQLVERGQLDLAQPASKYLRNLPPGWRDIPVEQLLNHASGLPEYFDPASIGTVAFPATAQAAFDAQAHKPLQFTPGTNTRYTQTNFLVLAAILEAQYGMPYRRIVTERIVDVLGLKNTYFGPRQVQSRLKIKSYIGKNGQLTPDTIIQWPEYGIVHAELYTNVDDLGTFLNALSTERLFKHSTAKRLWKPYRYKNGEAGQFASGWDYGTSGRFQHVGHDGGTKVRARLLFNESFDDTYAFIYLTNGSARNVWSRTLLESLMAVAAPDQFQGEVLSQQLITTAAGESGQEPTMLIKQLLEAGSPTRMDVERIINNTGYAAWETFGPDAAIPVFELNSTLFPASVNVWDSLVEIYSARGDGQKASAASGRLEKLRKR